MNNKTKKSTVQLLSSLFQLKANQGHAAKNDNYRQDYNKLIIIELYRLEKLSP